MLHRILLLSPFLATVLPAQATLVVDALGGPGTHPTIAAALAVAAPGDLIEVTAQPNVVYAGFTTSLGVHLFGVGDPVLQPFAVANLPAGQQFTAEALQLQSGSIDLRDCVGPVHLEALVGFCDPTGCTPAPGLSVLRCALVTANLCEFTGQLLPAVAATDSSLVLSECNGIGSDATGSLPAAPAAQLVRCTTSIAGGDWLGGSENGTLPASPALLLDSGTLELTGDVTNVSGGQLNVFAAAIDTLGGTVRIDPAVVLQPASSGPTVTGTGTVVPIDIPFTTIAVEGQNGSLVVSGKFVPQTLGALLFGVPLAPIPVPALGQLWLNPAWITTLVVGNYSSRGKLVHVASIPPVPALRGLVVGAQAFGFGLGQLQPQFGNPAFGVLD